MCYNVKKVILQGGGFMKVNVADLFNAFSESAYVQENRKLRLENIELQKQIVRLEGQIDKLSKRQIGRKKTITKGMEKKAIKYYDAGMSYREIGKRLNISHASVKNIIDKN